MTNAEKLLKANERRKELFTPKEKVPFRNSQIHSVYMWCVRYIDDKGFSTLEHFKTEKEAQDFCESLK